LYAEEDPSGGFDLRRKKVHNATQGVLDFPASGERSYPGLPAFEEKGKNDIFLKKKAVNTEH